jgi:ABC-type lipoprotein release transport system permease subunit
VGAYGLSRLVENRLFGVGAVDLPSYLGAAGLIAAVAVLACVAPARAAVLTDAVETLRRE